MPRQKWGEEAKGSKIWVKLVAEDCSRARKRLGDCMVISVAVVVVLMTGTRSFLSRKRDLEKARRRGVKNSDWGVDPCKSLFFREIFVNW